MMTLDQYLTLTKITQADFASMVLTHQGTISKLCKGKRPGWELARRIEDATKGAVPVAVWASVKGEDAA
jgi:hypothetical protein